MPTYNDLRPADDLKKQEYALVFPDMKVAEKKRTIRNLLTLRQGLSDQITAKRADNNLLVCSWNIKEFGHTTQRLPETYFYIAEIMARFDLIAVQEIKSGLDDLYIVMRLLGDDWGYLVNDITEGVAGNSERSGYIFNRKRVEFAGLAGEIVLWSDLTTGSTVQQLKRTPYITGFTAGWKTFSMVNVHLHPGDRADDVAFRKEEVRLLLNALKEKGDRGRLWSKNLILCGDFNLYAGANKDDPTIQLISDAGYREVESLVGVDTNASQTEAYDRLLLTRNEYFTLGTTEAGIENGGVFPLFDYLYRDGEEQTYKKYMKIHYTGNYDLDDPARLRSYYKNPWRKNQLSDHYPVWFELIIDSSDEFLSEKLAGF